MSMPPMYDRSIDPQEMAQLALQWADVRRQQVTLVVDDPFLTGEDQMLTMDGRRAEICGGRCVTCGANERCQG